MSDLLPPKDEVTKKQVAAFRKMISGLRVGESFHTPSTDTVLRLLVWGDKIAEDWERLSKPKPAHDLDKCLACDKNIDVCCGEWFYGDTEDGLKVHKRCEKRWAKIVAEIMRERDKW